SCRKGLVPEPGERCDSCGRPLISEQGRCLNCRNGTAGALDRGVLLFPYTGKYRRLLGAYKFGKNLGLGHFFAEQIRDTLKNSGKFPQEAVALVPVPPRPGKIRKNGWDQVEYLAKLLDKGAGAPPVCRCLRRLSSRNQKTLNREDRKINLQGRIILRRKAPRQAIIFDDVCTTGSTLDACAGALKAGGAEKVYGLCLFYD
ncbi:MAG: ComF family protein, partial [Treponema sp.]|nr:ComF family protein [Treponema sp.]